MNVFVGSCGWRCFSFRQNVEQCARTGALGNCQRVLVAMVVGEHRDQFLIRRNPISEERFGLFRAARELPADVFYFRDRFFEREAGILFFA